MGWKDEMDNFVVQKNILSTPSKTTFSLKQNWYLEADFTWLGETHSFIITRWMSQSAVDSFRLFFKDQTRDVSNFGSLSMDGNLNVTTQQKRQIIRKCCEDVIGAIELIIQTYKKCLLDYAVWYRDKRPSGKIRNTYSEFITNLACDCIIHGGILASSEWKIVEYP